MSIFLAPALAPLFSAHPLTLVDIGARGGLQPNWRAARKHLRVVGFEPDPREHARLQAGADPQRAVYINAAVCRATPGLSGSVSFCWSNDATVRPPGTDPASVSLAWATWNCGIVIGWTNSRLASAEEFASKIHYWTTPQKQCVDGSGDNCTAYNEWVDKWQQIRG